MFCRKCEIYPAARLDYKFFDISLQCSYFFPINGKIMVFDMSFFALNGGTIEKRPDIGTFRDLCLAQGFYESSRDSAQKHFANLF